MVRHLTMPNFVALAARPSGVREKRYNFYTLHYFGAPGDPLGQSSTVWVVIII